MRIAVYCSVLVCAALACTAARAQATGDTLESEETDVNEPTSESAPGGGWLDVERESPIVAPPSPAQPEWTLGLAVTMWGIATAVAAPGVIMLLADAASISRGGSGTFDIWAPGALLVNAPVFGILAIAFAIADMTRGHAPGAALRPDVGLVIAGALMEAASAALVIGAMLTPFVITCYEFGPNCDVEKNFAMPALLGHGIGTSIVGLALVANGLRGRVSVARGPGDVGIGALVAF